MSISLIDLCFTNCFLMNSFFIKLYFILQVGASFNCYVRLVDWFVSWEYICVLLSPTKKPLFLQQWFLGFGDEKSASYDLKSQISRLWSYSLILCFLHLKNIYLPTPLSELHFCVWSIDKAIFTSLLVLLCSVQLTRKKRLNPLVLSFWTKILTEILDEHWETKCPVWCYIYSFYIPYTDYIIRI